MTEIEKNQQQRPPSNKVNLILFLPTVFIKNFRMTDISL